MSQNPKRSHHAKPSPPLPNLTQAEPLSPIQWPSEAPLVANAKRLIVVKAELINARAERASAEAKEKALVEEHIALQGKIEYEAFLTKPA